MDREQIPIYLGFEKCEWGPEAQDVCENCGKENVQLYFGSHGGYHPDEGDYWCLDCICKLHEQNQKDLRAVEL